jgi:hypothetical protein
MQNAYNGEGWTSHFRCLSTLLNFVYIHTSKTEAPDIVHAFPEMAFTRFSHKVKYIRLDGETSLAKRFDRIFANNGITREDLAPYTLAQNDAAERSRVLINVIERTMRIACSLPADLWPEPVKAAGYLLN